MQYLHISAILSNLMHDCAKQRYLCNYTDIIDYENLHFIIGF